MSLPLAFIDDDQSDTDSEASFISKNSSYAIEKSQSDDKNVTAVIVHTNSIILRADIPQYASHLLPPTDAIFASHPSPISKVFGIPLVARAVQVADVLELKPYLCEAQMPNLSVRSLFRECDVTCCDETAGPYEWDQEFGMYKFLVDGPVLIARKDRKPLHPMHVRMVLEYLEESVDPLFEEYKVERKRWKKLMDTGEYRDKINEMRGDVEAMLKESKMRLRWMEFKKQNEDECLDVKSMWDA